MFPDTRNNILSDVIGDKKQLIQRSDFCTGRLCRVKLSHSPKLRTGVASYSCFCLYVASKRTLPNEKWSSCDVTVLQEYYGSVRPAEGLLTSHTNRNTADKNSEEESRGCIRCSEQQAFDPRTEESEERRDEAPLRSALQQIAASCVQNNIWLSGGMCIL